MLAAETSHFVPTIPIVSWCCKGGMTAVIKWWFALIVFKGEQFADSQDEIGSPQLYLWWRGKKDTLESLMVFCPPFQHCSQPVLQEPSSLLPRTTLLTEGTRPEGCLGRRRRSRRRKIISMSSSAPFCLPGSLQLPRRGFGLPAPGNYGDSGH